MKKIETKPTVQLPTSGLTILVRDARFYIHSIDFCRFYRMNRNYSDKIEQKELKDTDILYNFPEGEQQIWNSLSQGLCLDKFKIGHNQGDILGKVDELLRYGKIVGVQASIYRYHLTLKDGIVNWVAFTNSKKSITGIHFMNTNCDFYEFDDIYEIGAWLHKA